MCILTSSVNFYGTGGIGKTLVAALLPELISYNDVIEKANELRDGDIRINSWEDFKRIVKRAYEKGDNDDG